MSSLRHSSHSLSLACIPASFLQECRCCLHQELEMRDGWLTLPCISVLSTVTFNKCWGRKKTSPDAPWDAKICRRACSCAPGVTPGTNLTSYDIKLIGSTTVTKYRAWRGSRLGKFWWERGVLGPVVPEPYAEDVCVLRSVSRLPCGRAGRRGRRRQKQRAAAKGGSVSLPLACLPVSVPLFQVSGSLGQRGLLPPPEHLGLHQTFRSGKENCYGNM